MLFKSIVLFFVIAYITESIIDNHEDLYNEKKLKEEKDKKVKIISRVNKMQNICLSVIFFTGLISFIVAIILLISVPRNISGKVSQINSIESSNSEQGVQLNGYYVVEYDRVEGLVTLTIYVKNNSDRLLKRAVVTEKNSGKYAVVENLKAGEETIIGIATKKSDIYDFNISEIEFEN